MARSKSWAEMPARGWPLQSQTEHVYGEGRYATNKTWPWKRSIIYKAGVERALNKEPKDNQRFCGHEPTTGSAEDLRAGLLSAGRRKAALLEKTRQGLLWS